MTESNQATPNLGEAPTGWQPNPDINAGMRAYLQRAEVRLSTMHRVAGAFLSGAGLLILLPAFLRDVFSGILQALLNFDGFYIFVLLSCLCVVIVLPVYGLYLLFRDLVEFYFVNEHPGWDSDRFFPRFVLSGVSIAKDEYTDKESVTEILQRESYRNFVVSDNDEDYDYFSRIAARHGVGVIPPGRTAFIGGGADERRDTALWTAYGLTGTNDLELVEEVAKTEASLARHAFLLRRLVLRYAKALLLFVMTTLVMIVIYALLYSDNYADVLLTQLIILLAGFQVWSALAPWTVRLPIHWIWTRSSRRKTQSDIAKDPQLTSFETWVFWGAVGVVGIQALVPTLSFAIRYLGLQVDSIVLPWMAAVVLSLTTMVAFASLLYFHVRCRTSRDWPGLVQVDQGRGQQQVG